MIKPRNHSAKAAALTESQKVESSYLNRNAPTTETIPLESVREVLEDIRALTREANQSANCTDLQEDFRGECRAEAFAYFYAAKRLQRLIEEQEA